MKQLFKSLMSLTLLSASTLSFSQTINHGKYQQFSKINIPRQHFIEHILQQQSLRTAAKNKQAAKTTELAERLIAESSYNFSDSLFAPIGITDSANFAYSAGRSSTFNYNTMAYDNSYALIGDAPFGLASSIGSANQNDAPSTLSDTTLIWNSDNYMLTFNFADTRYALYDANNNITDYADLYLQDSTTTYADNRCINTFAGTNISSSLVFNWDYGVWDTSLYRIFMYNGSGQVYEDSSSSYSGGVWMPTDKWIYTFDTSGNMTEADFYEFDGTNWTIIENYIMTYYNDNLLHTANININTTGFLQPYVIDSFGYTTGINYVTYTKAYNYFNGSLSGYSISTDHISTLGLPDTLYTSNYDTTNSLIYTGGKVFFTYDSYDEPITATQYNFNVTDTLGDGYYDTTADYITYYYYELYTEVATSGVNNIASQNINIKVYPNPATNEIYISQTGITQGAMTYITLINALGQTVRTESLPWMSTTETLSVSDLIPGTYWLLIQDKNGNNLCKQAIVKQ